MISHDTTIIINHDHDQGCYKPRACARVYTPFERSYDTALIKNPDHNP